MDRIHLVECPRDALQGWPHQISTEDKVAYYRALIDVGFDTIDLGSFVSAKAIPSMANTAKVLTLLGSGLIIASSIIIFVRESKLKKEVISPRP